MTTDTIDDRDKPSPDWTRPPEPAVHRAARHGDLEALRMLLGAGADINQRADLEFDNGALLMGLTTLMVAARSIDGATTETLRWLVEHGADLRARSRGGASAAWYAAGDGGRWRFLKRVVTPDHAERLRYLLDLGLDPCERSSNGRSLLTEACRAGDPRRVRLLLERGAPVRPTPGKSARGSVVARSPGVAVQVGPEGAREAPRGAMSSFQIPIFCASQSGSAECVALLLQAGADPNARDSSGETPLMVAGSGAVVQALLGAGADLLAVEQYGKDALEAILEESCVGGALGPERFAVARAMLDAGAGIERVDGFGKARLASAAFGHHSDAVDFLLGLGARADALDSQGGTPLHAICWQGEYSNVERSRACERIIRSLVAAGASVHARDLQGRTPMHQAAGGDMGNPTAIRTLLELGADADPVDDRGDTPLMSAVFESETECVRLLLAAGADPTRKGEDGRFVLDIARDQVQVWESIVASGPDIERAKALQLRNKRFAEKYPSGRGLGPTDLSALMNDEAESHRDALETAIETLRVIEDAMRTRGGEWDGNADPNS